MERKNYTKAEQNEMLNTLVNSFAERIDKLERLAATTDGKWINLSSNDMVLQGYDYFRNEEGHMENRLGINGTGYTTRYEDAQVFDTAEEAYNNGNFYLETLVNGKRITIHVGPAEASPYFTKKAKELKDTRAFMIARLAEINA